LSSAKLADVGIGIDKLVILARSDWSPGYRLSSTALGLFVHAPLANPLYPAARRSVAAHHGALIRTLRLPCPHLDSALAVPVGAVLRAVRAASGLSTYLYKHRSVLARRKDSYKS
jgi:hypothetical protein